MKIRKLTITGFRSFTGTTEIRFENGLAGIRGMTEREKTDLADAVSFLMGTSTPTRAEITYHYEGITPEDTIHTEVSMELLNSDEVAGEGGKRVFARRMSPSGITGYYVNDTDCDPERFRQLLSDFRAGRYGFSLIDRHIMSGLAGNRNDCLKKMIHAAAGTILLQDEIFDLHAEIAAEEQHYEKLDALYEEAEQKRRNLTGEARRETEYRALSNACRDNEKAILMKMIRRLEREEQNLRVSESDLDRRILEVRKERESARARVQEILQRLSDADRETGEAAEQREQTQLELRDRKHRTDLLDAEIAHRREKILSLARDREREQRLAVQLEKEKQNLEQETAETDRSAQETGSRIRDGSRSLDSSRENYDQIEKEYDSLNDDLKRSEKEFSLEEAGLSGLKELLSGAQDRKMFLLAEQNAVNVSRLETELEDERKRYRADQKAFEAEEIRHRRAKEQSGQLALKEEKIRKSLEENEKAHAYAVSREDIIEYRTESIHLEREHRLLEKDLRKLETEQESVRSVAEETGSNMEQLLRSMDAGAFRIEQLIIRISDERRRLNRIREEIDRLDSEENLLYGRIEDAGRKVEQLKADSSRIRRKMDPMHEPADEWTAAITLQEQKLREDEKHLAEIKTRSEVLRTRSGEIQRQIDDIRNRERTLERIMSEELEELRSAETERESAEAAARSLDSLLDAHTGLLKRSRAGKAGIIGELSRAFGDYEIVLQRLRTLQTEKGVAAARVSYLEGARAELAETVLDRFDVPDQHLPDADQFPVLSMQEMRKEARRLRNSMRLMGSVNFRASEELERETARSRELLEQKTALTAAIRSLREEAHRKEQVCRNSFRAFLNSLNDQLRMVSAERQEAFNAEVRSDSKEDVLNSSWYIFVKRHADDPGERIEYLSSADAGRAVSCLLEAAVRAGGDGLYVMTGLEQFFGNNELEFLFNRLSASGKTGVLLSEPEGSGHSGNHYVMKPSAGAAVTDHTEYGE